MNELECIRRLLNDLNDIYNCKMSVVDKCEIASTISPEDWMEEILWPQYGQSHSIFGDRHVAMDRENSIGLIDALVWTKLCESNGEARKAIRNNGIRVNRKIVNNIGLKLDKSFALKCEAIVLEFGKYNFGIIELC